MKKIFSFMLALTIMLGGLAGFASMEAQTYATTGEARYATTYAVPGGTYVGPINETIVYASKQESAWVHNPGLPGYGSSFTCGVVAGGTILSWYNYKLAGGNSMGPLIPGHTIGTTFLGQWRWGTATSQLAAMYAQLSINMNETPAGVTISGYHNGMSAYVSGKGYTYTKTNIMGSGGELLNADYKTQIQSGKLMTIFVDGFNFGNTALGIQSYSDQNYDIVALEEYTGAHAIAVYGYREITYKDAQGNPFRQDIYLYVHTGFGGDLGVIRINTHCTLDNAFVTHIA